MRRHVFNAAWNVLDYVAYPAAMLVSAPLLLHHLGTPQYGIWIVCTAIISTGGIVASGFGDANIQHVATARSKSDVATVLQTVRNLMGINVVLGLAVMVFSLIAVKSFARHVVPISSTLYSTCVHSFILASLLMFVRAIESVCISTQRAFERYDKAVEISITVRIITILIAVILAYSGHGVTSIMANTFGLTTLGTGLQLSALKRLLGASSLLPRFDQRAFRSLFGFGIFSWLQAVSSVIFSQSDRLLLGATLGASAVTSYALCVQIAQPIYGIAAAGLHFLFPYLAGRMTQAHGQLRRAIVIAFGLNLLFVFTASVAVLLTGSVLMRHWVGSDIARQAAPVLAPIVWGFALLSLSVPAYYALLAFGRFKTVTFLSVIGGTIMLLVFANLSNTGIHGIADARIVFAIISLMMYVPLLRILMTSPAKTSIASISAIGENA